VILDKSGSCAIAVLIVDDMCYIANVGDSRAMLSQNGGVSPYTSPANKHAASVVPLSQDQIYQTATTITSSHKTSNPENMNQAHKEIIIGP
jgi:serine/threonine protein phosphatase PrpC